MENKIKMPTLNAIASLNQIQKQYNSQKKIYENNQTLEIAPQKVVCRALDAIHFWRKTGIWNKYGGTICRNQ